MKTLVKLLTVITSFAVIPAAAEQAAMVLTGSISSVEQHIVTAPKTDNWRVQIQWLADEGEVVQKGDSIAVFDSGGIESRLEQESERLETQRLELKKKELDLQQAVTEAEGKLAVAIKQVGKARIEATIKSDEVSDYDKGQYQLTLERALVEKLKAEQSLLIKAEEKRTGIEKQQIEILKLEESIAFQQSQLGKMNVKARYTGPVSHVMHPWQDQKITAGSTVQSTWEVLRLQGQKGYQIEAWIHEIDAQKIATNSRVNISLDAYPGNNYSGEIKSIASQSEQLQSWGDSAYYRVWVTFSQQPKVKLMPGMSVRVMLGETNES